MQAARTLEDEAVRRPTRDCGNQTGAKEKIVGYETEYSDTLLLAALKANNPDKFRDRVEQVNIQISISTNSALRYSINWLII